MWLRLRQVALVAEHLQPALEALRQNFGLEVGYVDPGVATFGLENSLMPVGSQFIEVVAPVKEGTAGGRYLERRRGDGGYMVICQCDDHTPRKQRVAELGIRKVLEFDEGAYHCMQLHPADTGGSFLEIDFQEGDPSPDGPWAPAGWEQWRDAVRTHIVAGIAAVEIQGSDPHGLAARWSDIVEIPLGKDSDGNPVIPLENAEVRFVEATDGRGEGLGGMDLLAADAQRAGETLHAVGMRFRLVASRPIRTR